MALWLVYFPCIVKLCTSGLVLCQSHVFFCNFSLLSLQAISSSGTRLDSSVVTSEKTFLWKMHVTKQYSHKIFAVLTLANENKLWHMKLNGDLAHIDLHILVEELPTNVFGSLEILYC